MNQTALAYLLGSYLHQDIDLEFGDEWGAVDHFIEFDAHRAIQVPAEIDALLASHSGESELKEYVHSAGAEFLPVKYPGGYREWLSEIGRRCREGMPGVNRRKRKRDSFPGTR